MVATEDVYLSLQALERDLEQDGTLKGRGTHSLIRIATRFLYDYPPGETVEVPLAGGARIVDFFSLPVILVGEAGSGVTSAENRLALGFWRTWPGRPIIRFSLSRWLAYSISGGPIAPATGASTEDPGGLAARLDRILYQGDAEGRPDALLRYFLDLAASGEEALFFLYDLEDYPHAGRLLSGLRRIWDWFHHRSLKLALSVPDARVLEERIFSEIGSASTLYRPPFFGEPEIRGLWRMHAPETPEHEPDPAPIFEWTGGQPMLCRLLLERIRRAPGRPLLEHGEWVFRHRPQQVSRWQKALAEIVIEDGHLRDVMRMLLSGQAIPADQLGRETLPLFSQGWIRFERNGPRTLCHIRSRFHRHWGKEPLQDPSAFTEHA